MTTKKVKELTYDDLGKQVVLTEPNGDRASGDLKMIIFSKSIRLEIGGLRTWQCGSRIRDSSRRLADRCGPKHQPFASTAAIRDRMSSAHFSTESSLLSSAATRDSSSANF